MDRLGIASALSPSILKANQLQVVRGSKSWLNDEFMIDQVVYFSDGEQTYIIHGRLRLEIDYWGVQARCQSSQSVRKRDWNWLPDDGICINFNGIRRLILLGILGRYFQVLRRSNSTKERPCSVSDKSRFVTQGVMQIMWWWKLQCQDFSLIEEGTPFKQRDR